MWSYFCAEDFACKEILNNNVGSSSNRVNVLTKLFIRHSAALLGINLLVDAAHAINDNTVPLLYIED